MAGGGPVIIGGGGPPIGSGLPFDLGRRVYHGPPAISVLSAPGDTSLAITIGDLRTSLPSGVISLSDGTLEALPLSGINYGLPSSLIQFGGISGVEGDSLAGMMREFPLYTRVNRDRTSLGAQFFTAVSRVADEISEAQVMFMRSRFPVSHPLFEQGVVYEHNYNEISEFNPLPQVSGRLGTSWFTLPLVRDEYSFWTSPPTRVQATTAEIDGLTILDWTQVGSSGLVDLLSADEVHLPLFNQVVVEVSGAQLFSFFTDTTEIVGMVYLHGHWPQEGFRHQMAKVEGIPVYANVPVASRFMYRSITKIETRGLDPNAYVRVRILNFNAPWKSDSLGTFWPMNRNEETERIFWQICTDNTPFTQIVQPETREPISLSAPIFLARTRLLTDTIFDQDIEWDVLETWKLSDTDGNALSGIVDIAPVPNSHFMLLLNAWSGIHVIDTFRPAINMQGFAELTAAPARIEVSYPKGSYETPGEYTVNLHANLVATADGIQRWRWAVHHEGNLDIITSTSVYPFSHNSGWQNGSDENVVIPDMNYVVSGTGQYVFELSMVTDNNISHQTFTGFQQVEKRSLGLLPIRGIGVNPSGLEFDSYGRPWVLASGNAVRLIMNTDVGIWIEEQRVLLTREQYDEVQVTS